MVEVEQIFRIVLYIVLIIVALLFIYIVFWPMYQQSSPPQGDIPNIPNNVNNDDILVDDISTDDIVTKPPRKYRYDKMQQGLSLSDTPQHRESTLKYREFVGIIFKDEFLINYHKALQTSLFEKRKIYIRKQRQINADLRSNQTRVGNDFSAAGVHDSNLERLRRASTEINQIVKAIDYRLSTLSIEQIRTDFHDLIHDPEYGLESLVGREDVKDIMALQIFTFTRNPKLFFTTFQNITIYGRSGVGKSKLAETIGFVYAKSGILVRRKVRNVTKQEFTSSYVNESAQLTRELLLSTLEGVLFIDEAYDLMPPKTTVGRGIDHGHEAVTELVNFLDKNIGLSIVIAAGYEDEMEERFIGANQGLDRRFPHKIKLDDYSTRQLTDIMLKFMGKSAPHLDISDNDAGYIYTLIDFLYTEKSDIFDKQAGDMLILVSYLARSIYGSVTRYWISGNNENNAIMILDGFNDYLRSKGISIMSQKEPGRGPPTPDRLTSIHEKRPHQGSPAHRSRQSPHPSNPQGKPGYRQPYYPSPPHGDRKHPRASRSGDSGLDEDLYRRIDRLADS